MEEKEIIEISYTLYKEMGRVLENQNLDSVIHAVSKLNVDLIIDQEWDLEQVADYFRVLWRTVEKIKEARKET